MKIVIICEGKTERAFRECLRRFLSTRLSGKMPSLRFDIHDGAIPTGKKRQRVVKRLLSARCNPADAVIALTDVYPGYADADAAKVTLGASVDASLPFHVHVALHDFEAWLLPYWDEITRLAGRQARPFGAEPEKVDHGNPPAHRLARLFEAGECRDSYSKPRDAARILRNADLMVAIQACPELKAFVNTILRLCDKDAVLP